MNRQPKIQIDSQVNNKKKTERITDRKKKSDVKKFNLKQISLRSRPLM